DTTGSQLSISHGERQLFALARAILCSDRIVLLDEACSSVDIATNVLMQQLIRNEFSGRTILAVEHSLSNVLDFDRIMVLDN
ncbi:P-loop containing nucleoside triphosphate hydrolase protein, partial [Bisporella sp. PMI_857]